MTAAAPALAPEVAEGLREAAQALAKATEGAVPRWVVRPYVWALYCGDDPAAAALRAHFGAAPVGEGAREAARGWVERLARVGVDVPRQGGRAS